MTYPVSTGRSDHLGSGAVDTYSYGFKIFTKADLRVIKEVILTGLQTVLAEGSGNDYTVTGVGDENGGNIILTAGNLPATDKLAIRIFLPLKQAFDVKNQGPFFPGGHEDQFDKIVILLQQQQDEINRSLKISETTDPATVDTQLPTAAGDQVLGWNTAADAIENKTLSSLGAIALPVSNGIVVSDGTDQFIGRTLSKTGNITIDNGDGQSGNPTVNSTAIDTSISTNSTNITNNTTAVGLRPLTTDLASVSNAKGASTIGLEDAAGKTSAADLEAVITELLANTLRVADGTYTGDNANNRTISTSIPAGSTIVRIDLTSVSAGLSHVRWLKGATQHTNGNTQIANGTTTFTVAGAGIDFIVGGSGHNVASNVYTWQVVYKL